MRSKILILFILHLLLSGCLNKSTPDLYEGFVNPPAEARPFVRWWWNGNRITEKEIIRQLDVLHDAGIGGVEINPIEIPSWCDTAGTKELVWLSPEWNRLLAFASEEAQKRGMITDLIVGSGWPFGGEFLSESELIQRVITNTLSCKGGDIISENAGTLHRKALMAQSRKQDGEPVNYNLLFITLIPENPEDTSGIINLGKFIDSSGNLKFSVPAGKYNLVYGIVEKGHRRVQNGAPGAAGPVMDHYRKEITLAYLNRLKKISEDTGIPLARLIRALFCDSIELAGANWTDNMAEIFRQFYGYDPEPWYPFIFYDPYRGYTGMKMKKEFHDQVKRIRYDYNKLLVRIFLDNFTKTFQEFCTANNLLCRYQAYGTPFLMGMMEGNMITDIPESNNWLFSGSNIDSEEWKWNQHHGYMIWNLYAASGGHLKGRKIISCEAMTNTRGVFKTSLEDIKRHDDMNFITGINHSVLHGYNYSPQEAGFPGWIRFGTYFSEQNTWWPYFRKWSDYNARLSFIFQNTKPVKNIAVIGPTGDIWSEYGLVREPFHTVPWYCYRLWETLSNNGSSCDYIDESIVQNGKKGNGMLSYGPMSYKALILCNVRSVEPETVTALRDFAAGGGKIVFADAMPERSLSFKDAEENDRFIQQSVNELINRCPDRVFSVDGPDSPEELSVWTNNLLSKINIDPDVVIKKPDKNIYQIHNVAGERDIWFFVNPNLSQEVYFTAEFQVKGKIPWLWNPEDGSRKLFPLYESPGKLEINLQPLQSLLIVFEPGSNGKTRSEEQKPGQTITKINGPWEAEFVHHNGKTFRRTLNEIMEFGTSDDPELNSFAGRVNYATEFESDGKGRWILLPEVNKGVTELILNGRNAGLNWYGKPLFRVDSLLKQGKNVIEVRYTTLLSNYVRSLKDNHTAMRWAQDYKPVPSGLDGEITIIR